MERIIENEIYRLIKRDPTIDEKESAMKYLDFCADDLTYGENIPELMEDWLRDEMKQCECCGTWNLRSEMVSNMYGYFCNEECEEEYHKDRKERFDDEMYELTNR